MSGFRTEADASVSAAASMSTAMDDERSPGSRATRAVDGDHGRAASVDGVDDLGAVDALEVHRGDAEVGVSELALDDQQGHTSRAISTAWACRSWCGAKRRRTPARAAVSRS